MIFFSVWLPGYSREVLRELFWTPNKPLIAIGILGILVSNALGLGFWL